VERDDRRIREAVNWAVVSVSEEDIAPPKPDPVAEIQQRRWQAYQAAEHAKAVEQFGPFIAWAIWPYKITIDSPPA
jgi:hypothetical protein